jgi:hypothetical protein
VKADGKISIFPMEALFFFTSRDVPKFCDELYAFLPPFEIYFRREN